MNILALQADLLAAIGDRNRMRATHAGIAAKLVAAEAEHDQAEQAALTARDVYTVALGADDPTDAASCKASFKQTTDRYDVAVLTVESLETRVQGVGRELAALTRGAAYAKERVAVALAGQREIELRAAAVLFAEKKAAWHRACASAAEARQEACGRVGEEPVAHTGFKAALLVSAKDGGLLAIFARAGLAANLTPIPNIRGLSESELLKADSNKTPTPEEHSPCQTQQ